MTFKLNAPRLLAAVFKVKCSSPGIHSLLQSTQGLPYPGAWHLHSIQQDVKHHGIRHHCFTKR
jgi:hypothetical protein